MKFPIKERFKLSESFIEKYVNIQPNWGFGGLSEFVFMRTYSRVKEDGKNEMWYETVRRVVEGVFTIQKQHVEDYRLGWNQAKAQRSAQEMYDRMFNFKMLGSGRSLWSLGTDIINERGLTESLYNCSFLSTKDITLDTFSEPFAQAMDFLMLGVGVGFDTKGAGRITIKQPKENKKIFVIPDSREGWVESLRLALNSYVGGDNYEFDYSEIRPAGVPIRTFGGISGGHKPLEELHIGIKTTLNKNIGQPITITSIADIINMVGRAVVSGNVRRSAELLIGENVEEFLTLKEYETRPERQDWAWASNNSIEAVLGMDYNDVAKQTSIRGEPGFLYVDNMKKYGRMREDEANYKDFRVTGMNPCCEITLEDKELCNLVEIIPSRHENLEDFLTTIKYAYLFGKTITLLNTNWPETNKVMLRNRRIGLSITGITQFIADKGIHTLRNWMEEGYNKARKYDKVFSEWFAVPESIKITTNKPSGTLSLVAGVTPGVHFPESKYYIRRVRLAKDSPFVEILKKSFYKVEPASEDPERTVVVEFPVSVGDKTRTLNDVSMWEQLELAAFCQHYWADNGVSVTITFKESEKNQIANALDLYQYRLKAVSFLPKLENSTAYVQMPYEEVSKEQYEEMSQSVLPLDFTNMFSVESLGEKYCNNDACSI